MTARYRIVVADDDSGIVESLSDDLNQLADRFKDRVEVVAAHSATQVLRILSDCRVDALFLDYHFEGGMSGDEIIDRIVDPFAQTFIVLMSARGRRELDGTIIKRHKQLRTRFKFLRKPFEYLEVQAKYLEIGEFFASLPYPFPLAYASEVLLASSTSQGRITAMKDVIESVAKYGVAVLMADLDRLPSAEGAIGIDLNLSLTLGAWLLWLNKAIECLGPHRDAVFMPELYQLFGPTGPGSIKCLDLMFKFKDEVRDPQLGHGYTKEERWYAELVSEYADPLRSLLEDLSFAARYILLVPEKVDFVSDRAEEYEYEVRVLMGTEARFKLTKMRSRLRLTLREVYLYSQADRALSLNPFFVYEICRSCSLARLYLIDDIKEKGIVYNAFCNHRLKDTERRHILEARFAKFRNG